MNSFTYWSNFFKEVDWIKYIFLSDLQKISWGESSNQKTNFINLFLQFMKDFDEDTV